MKNNIVNKTVTSLKYSVSLKLLEQVSIFSFSIILARLLSPEEFGVIALSNLVIHYANNFTNMGWNNALIQSVTYNEKKLNSVFTIDIGMSLVLMILLYSYSFEISKFFNSPNLENVLRWMALFFVITTFDSIPKVILKRNIQFKFIYIYDYLLSLSNYLSAITLAYLGYSYWSIVYPTLFLKFVFSIFLIIKTKWIPKIKYNHKEMKAIYSFGIWGFIRSQLNLFVVKVDYFIIGKYLPINDLGIYEKSFELTERSIKGITMPFNAVLFSSFSRLQNDPKTQVLIFLESIKVLGFIIIPGIFGLLSVAPYFVNALLGQQWQRAVVPIQILSISLFFKLIGGTIASLNIANGNFRLQAFFEIISAVVLCTLCLIYVKYGIEAICISVLIYSIINMMFGIIILKINVKLKLFKLLNSLLYPFIVSAFMFICVCYSRNYFFTQLNSILHLFVLVCIGVVVYGSIMIILIKFKIFSIKFM